MKKLSLLGLVLVPLLIVACGTSKPLVPNPDDEKKVQEYNAPLTRKPGQEVRDPVHGVETGLWYGAVSGTEGTNANGVAFVQYFEDGGSIVTVNLNIAQAPEGKHYEAIVQNEDGSDVFTVGELRSIIGDSRHSAKIDTTYDTSKLHTITVVLLSDGAERGDTVATGTLSNAKQ